MIVVGGTSKVDMKLLYKVLEYLPDTYGLILLGDQNPRHMLPNNALKYLMESGDVPVIRLTDVEK